jgi:hypothetical protein
VIQMVIGVNPLSDHFFIRDNRLDTDRFEYKL